MILQYHYTEAIAIFLSCLQSKEIAVEDYALQRQ